MLGNGGLLFLRRRRPVPRLSASDIGRRLSAVRRRLSDHDDPAMTATPRAAGCKHARWAVVLLIVSATAGTAHATGTSPLPPAELPPAGTIAPAFQPRTPDPDPTKKHSDPDGGHVFGGA